MNNQPMFRKQQLKFMLMNLLAFTAIFAIFSMIIFHQVQSTLYSETDKELQRFRDMAIDAPFPGNSPSPRGEPQRENPNPRLIVLEWNQSGEIVNEGQIGSQLFESYFRDFAFDAGNIGEITNITVGEGYSFRTLLFEDTDAADNVAYTQLLINIEPEQTIIENFGELLAVCSLIFVLLSISASYLLSKRMMKPIILSWNKQAEFVENASHELRTPLTIIQNKLELLLTAPQEKIMAKFENIALSLSETRRLSKLTADLLTLARADSADIQLIKNPIDFDGFIEEASSPYIEIAESQDKIFKLELNAQTAIRADRERLHQLLVILLDNALKYTDEGARIGIRTYMEDGKAVLEVHDTGAGIKKENLPYIFDRFYREDKARSRETGGMGLGLSIAHWIVTSHSGTITAAANESQGATFKVKLPK